MGEITTLRSPLTPYVQSGPEHRLADWLDSLSPNTQRAYRRDLSAFAAYLQLETPGQAIATLCNSPKRDALAGVESFRDWMASRGLSSAAINRPLSTINSALRHLARADYGPGPLDVDQVRTEAKKDNRGPESSDIAAVLKRLETVLDARSIRDAAILRLGLQRALRRSEIAAMTLSDLDLEKGEARVIRKGKREKVTVTLSPSVTGALEKWLRVRTAKAGVEAVFVTMCDRYDQSGLQLSADAIYRIVRTLGGGARGWRPHGLRHAAISAALMRTSNLEAARELAGHANVSTTQRYIDDKGGLERLAVASLEGAFE